MIPLFDGHLDLAMNALEYERDPRLTVEQVREREKDGIADGRGTCMVSLPELRRGGTAVVTATLLARAKPWVKPQRRPYRDNNDWPTQEMAHAIARGQLAYYELLERRGDLRIITTRTQLQAVFQRIAAGETDRLGVIVMMEGADPIASPQDLPDWHEQGLRCLSLAHFGHSHYAAGTPPKDPASPEKDAPLTEKGRELLRHMSPLRMILDLTHLSDLSFWEAIEAYDGPVCATHCNCRALANTPRQLDDAQIRAIVQRHGVIGVAIHNGMLRCIDGQEPPRDQVSLSHVVDHIDHLCDLAGDAAHVAIGSDLDGGYGLEHTPREMNTHSDLHKLAPLLRDRGFTDADVAAIFHGNWLRFYTEHLPE